MGLAGEWVAGLALGVLTALWTAGLSVGLGVLVVGGLREMCLVGDLVYWANLLLGWPWPDLSLPALHALDFVAILVSFVLMVPCYWLLLWPVLSGLGLDSSMPWVESIIGDYFDWCGYKLSMSLYPFVLAADFLHIYWVWEPEAVERLEALAAGPLSGPPPLLDQATDSSVSVVLHDLRRIAAANKLFAGWLRDTPAVRLPWLTELVAALRPGNWGEESAQLAELLPGLRAALLQRPSPASPRLRALLLGLSADLSADQAHPPNNQLNEEARRLNQTALCMACDEDEDADVAAAAWKAVRTLSGPQEQISWGLKLLCQNPQRPMPRMGKVFDRHDLFHPQWFECPEGEVRAPLAGLATQARLGVRWAGQELSRVLVALPNLSQERREAFRDVGGFGSLAPPLLHALRPAVSQGFFALLDLFFNGQYDAIDERFVTHCLNNLVHFLRNNGTGPVERALAQGEWVRAGLVPLLRGPAAADWRPAASSARALLSLLTAAPNRLPSALLITSQAQAQYDAYVARRLPHLLPRTL